MLIAIEGIDGAGKTTQVGKLRDALKVAGELVVSSKEPTNGQWGSILRQSARSGRLSLDDELETFIKDRAEHVDTFIGPNLEAGAIVILDRYFYSTIAYQGARGANVDVVSNEMYSRFPEPDAVFILDVDAAVGIDRIAHGRGEEPNRFEDRDSLGEARQIFNGMRRPNIHRINGLLPIDAVHNRIVDLLIEGPLKTARCAKAYGCDDHLHCSYRLSGTCNWWNLRGKLLSGAQVRVS